MNDGFIVKGFDPNRCQDGLVIKYTGEKLKQNIDHNKKEAERHASYPPVFDDIMKYFSLAGSHLSVEVRCFKHGIAAQNGVARAIPEDDSDLRNLCFQSGHPGRKFIVLSEELVVLHRYPWDHYDCFSTKSCNQSVFVDLAAIGELFVCIACCLLACLLVFVFV